MEESRILILQAILIDEGNEEIPPSQAIKEKIIEEGIYSPSRNINIKIRNAIVVGCGK